ncbi:MAG TPA: hypothetical protein VFP70_07745 [Burkholderiales bacterium]|nr:hypothetical protein [Burkholderiales bacterium]
MKTSAGWMCLLALLGRPTLAADPAMVEREVWLCKGVTQSAPGEPLQPEARRLEFDFTSGDLLMSVGTSQYRTRFQASPRHYEAMFNLTLEGGVQVTESLHLIRAKGQITATARTADGRQMRLFRSNCHPEGVPEK